MSYAPKQNGLIQRDNEPNIEHLRAILAETKLPKELWPELATTVVCLKDRRPTSVLKVAPYEPHADKKDDRAIGTNVYLYAPRDGTRSWEKVDSTHIYWIRASEPTLRMGSYQKWWRDLQGSELLRENSTVNADHAARKYIP